MGRYLLALIQPKFKSSYVFTQNMPTLHEVLEFKSRREVQLH